MNLSRRKLLASFSAASLVSLTGQQKASATTTAAVPALPKDIGSYVKLLTPSDHGYDAHLDGMFPRLKDDPVFKKIAPYCALLTNIGNIPLQAFSTYWDIETGTGNVGAVLRQYFHPRGSVKHSARFGLKGNKTRFTGSIPALQPGATRLITPFFSWSPAHFLKYPAPKWKALLLENSSRKFLLQEMARSTSVTVQVDGLIVKNNVVIGTDRANLGTTFRVTRNAEHDEAYDVLGLVQSGATVESIRACLKEHAKAVLPERGDKKKFLYCKVRRRQARVLLRRLKHARYEQFIKTLKFLCRQPQTTTIRLAA